MQCLLDMGAGEFVLADPQPPEYQACTYLLVQPSELPLELFNITPAEGAQLSAAIVAVWAIAWVVKPFILALRTDES